MRSSRLVAVLGLALCASCAQGGDAADEAAMKAAIPRRLQPDGTVELSDADRKALGLQVVRAAEGELPESVTRFGRVRPTVTDESVVVSPVAGRIVGAPAVRLGAAVAAGAPILRIVPALAASEQLSVGVRAAELGGQIEGARRELAAQEAALARARSLASSRIVSEARLQEQEATVAAARARLAALERAAALQRPQGGAPLTLRAPLAGTVATLNASVGAIVQQGDLLARILRAGPRWVDVAVPPSARVGQRYEVAAAGAWLPARLVAAGAVVEADGTRHDRVQVDGPAAAQLLPGETVAVRVAMGAGRGVVLPESAIVPGVETDRVFVETSPGTFAARAVRVAARFGGEVRLASGVAPGQAVVVRGAMSLQGERRRRELPRAE